MKKKASVDPNYCNNTVLRQATRRMGQLYDSIIAPSGLRATQLGLLTHVVSLGEPTMRELAEDMVMDQSALGHTLKPLERSGYLELIVDPQDRRARRIRLTQAGTRKFEDTLVLWKTAQDSFEAAFGAEKAAELRAVLTFLASDDFELAFNAPTPSAPGD
ncbi:DNA-binding MarR family transcriptional regulator [Rhizobium leguminosarum]|uniref:DNA-binding MarR family transcriptional regulator n=1 Tax=Rhizobium leguminosarum TaxID=384 RepID=A0AAE2MF67_RHILE|nr:MULTISPECIES: MarR family winged helix-turn-helix transcriptional regulator [Rhizobium]MBB4288258.1 DNA-binding MarR family transcriptional regulator [Rhizobium leguminosarum]MBB4295650.1 DNA-binding MarR family transcriptional regulator [Rhizobium leguminosarum]MBB4307043.1 DNA-binding MarR family transcriptional regulator [Rhizobium leguminosarum]MBB4417375.1 DNA-binding MarR family transcriptional regulator [Rhizobium leguminosarum]MBB4432219.1 DNA-binding MarR family transcriptional reg